MAATLLTLSAPGKNALSLALMTSIVERLRAAAGQPVVLTGEGDAFCAGLNLKEVASLDAAGLVRFLDALEAMVDAIFHHDGPVVSVVNGHAIAGGCIVALASDVRVGVDVPTARIGLNEVPLGLRFPPKTWRLVRHRLPGHVAERVVLEGGLYPFGQALRLGLLDEVVPTVDDARAMAERICAAPLDAYRHAKRQLRAGALDVSDAEARAFRETGLPAWTGDDLKARLLAQLGKR